MKTRYGLALAHDVVRVVAVRRKQVVWAVEAPREEGQDLQETIAALLQDAPSSTWRRSALSVAVGPHASQVKTIHGLPAVKDPALLAAIVREGTATFFLKSADPLVTTGVRSVGPQAVLAAAIELGAVSSIRDACRAARWRLGCIAPTAVVLPAGIESQPIVWKDGGVALDITHSCGLLESIRSKPFAAADRPTAEPALVPELAALGDRAARFADAFGAALLDSREPLTLDAEAAGWWSSADHRRRSRAWAAAVGLGGLCLILSPLAATGARHRADARIHAVSPDQWKLITAALAQLNRVTASLEELRNFSNARSSAAGMLGGLAGALPDGNVIVNLEMTETQLQMVVLSRNPGELLTAVRALRGAQSAEFVGGLSRETVGGADLQRVTIRSGTSMPAPSAAQRGML